MPTIRTVTVKPSGGDYSSASAAEAGEQGNLVTLNRQLIIECYPMEDTSALSVAGYTVDETRNIIIRTPATARPNGSWTTSAYRLVTPTGAPSINVSMDYTILDGLQVRNTGNNATNDDVIRLYSWRSHIRVINCVVTGGYHGIMAVASATVGGYLIANNVVYGTYAGGIRYGGSAGLIARAINNTVYGCNTGSVAFRGGVENEGSYQEAINNLAVGNNGYAYKQAAGQSYNISSDATAAGTGCLINKSAVDAKFVSTTPGAEDLHIQFGSVAIGAGTDLSVYITTDIDGQTRSAPWDIGADQYVAAGGSVYTESLTSTVASVASIDDRQTYLEAASVLIQSGAALTDVQTMLESVITVAATVITAADFSVMVEQCLAQIQASGSVSDALAYVENLVVAATASASLIDLQQSLETLLADAQAVGTVTDVAMLMETLLTTVTADLRVEDTIEAPGSVAETLLVTATVAAEANVAQQYVEGITAVAQASGSLSDLQIFLDNLDIMGALSVSATDIAHYLDHVTVNAQAAVSVVDLIQGAFVGRYLFVDRLPPRNFIDRLPARSFIDTPRGRA